MLKNGNQLEKGLVNRLMSKRLAFSALVMLFAVTASMGIVSSEEEKGTYIMTIDSGYMGFFHTCLPSLSPDWEKVAFSTYENLGNGSEKLTLWVADMDGTGMKKLDVSLREESGGFHMILGWNPNSEKILYLEASWSPNDTAGGLWVISSDGTDKKPLGLEGQLTPDLIWSPDGDKILYMEEFVTTEFSDNASHTEDTKKFYTLNINDNSSTLIAEGTPLLWIADSNEIIYYKKEFTGHGDVQYTTWKLNPDRAIPTKLGSIDATPYDISPDGGKIVYADNGIRVENIDGSNPRQLTSSDEDGSAMWSPDSKRIAFITSEEGIRKGIWVMNSDGSDQKQLLSFVPTYYWGLMGDVWSEDGNRVAYANFDLANLTDAIYVLDAGEPPIGEMPLEEEVEVEATSTPEVPAEEEKRTPGFEAVFAIAGLLAVVHLFRRGE
jgi:PGF-CTERM protein